MEKLSLDSLGHVMDQTHHSIMDLIEFAKINSFYFYFYFYFHNESKTLNFIITF